MKDIFITEFLTKLSYCIIKQFILFWEHILSSGTKSRV